MELEDEVELDEEKHTLWSTRFIIIAFLITFFGS
jgi:hypothetical protein